MTSSQPDRDDRLQKKTEPSVVLAGCVRKLYRDGLLSGGGLVPVAVVADGPVASAPSPPIGAGRMSIELGCGARVVVDAGVDASALSRVLIALAAR